MGKQNITEISALQITFKKPTTKTFSYIPLIIHFFWLWYGTIVKLSTDETETQFFKTKLDRFSSF